MPLTNEQIQQLLDEARQRGQAGQGFAAYQAANPPPPEPAPLGSIDTLAANSKAGIDRLVAQSAGPRPRNGLEELMRRRGFQEKPQPYVAPQNPNQMLNPPGTLDALAANSKAGIDQFVADNPRPTAASLSDPGLPAEKETLPPPETRTDKVRRLLARKGLGSSVDKLTEGVTGLGGPGAAFNPKNQDPVLDYDIGTAQDSIGPEDQAFLAQYGIEVPPTMSMRRLTTMLPQIGRTMADRDRKRSLDLREEAIHTKDERERLRLARLPPKALQQVSDMRTVLKGLDRIDSLLASGKVSKGPASGRINALLQNAKLSDPAYASVRAEISNLVAQNIRAISGAQASELEVRRLKEQLPDLMQPGDTFDTLLARYRTQVETQYDELLRTHEQAHYETSQYARPGQVRNIIGPNGEEMELEPGAALPDGWRFE